jgi:hypothetical protein
MSKNSDALCTVHGGGRDPSGNSVVVCQEAGRAFVQLWCLFSFMEREKGLEPSTTCLEGISL